MYIVEDLFNKINGRHNILTMALCCTKALEARFRQALLEVNQLLVTRDQKHVSN